MNNKLIIWGGIIIFRQMKAMWSFIFLDYFFLVFHLALVLFNLFGWIWQPTRKANLILLLLTGASWFGLGIFYGWGYCPFTDWHWKVLHRLGEFPSENSYIQYLLRRIFNLKTGARLVDTVTLASYALALCASLFKNRKKGKPVKRLSSLLSCIICSGQISILLF